MISKPAMISKPIIARGQILPILALAIVALLGVAALGVDVFHLYWNRDRLQSSVDAAALAGALYSTNLTFTGGNAQCSSYSSVAQQAACSYAMNNGVLASEVNSITVNSSAMSVTVASSRVVPALFAKVLGFTQFAVAASATAVLEGLNSASNIIPIGLDSTTPYSYGQALTIHQSGCGAGCWQGVQLQSATNGISGGNAFQQNLQQGCNCTVNVGDVLTAETSAKVGPITSGVSNRIAAAVAADPAGTWGSHTSADIRAATVPLVNWTGCMGVCSVPVIGFAQVWITSNSGSDINIIFIRQVATGNGTSSAPMAGAYHTVLTQ
jgi:Flp pilus assembly protein TadG